MTRLRIAAWLWPFLLALPAGCSSQTKTPAATPAEVDTETEGASSSPALEEKGSEEPSEPAVSGEPSASADKPDCDGPYREADAECRRQFEEAQAECDKAGDQCDRRLIPTVDACLEMSGAEANRLMCRCEGRGEEEACAKLEAQ